jgi:hypothetical protein
MVHLHGTHVPVEEPSTASQADVALLNFDVRSTPESGHSPTRSECRLWARSSGWLQGRDGVASAEDVHTSLSQGSIQLFIELAAPHSISSSARASSDCGTVSPSAFPVLRLIFSSYFVGACTGRLAGFSPLRMRST